MKSKHKYKFPKYIQDWRKKERKKYLRKMAVMNELHVHFYIAKISNESESFIKIGISVDVENRLKSIPYNVKILYLITIRTDKAFDYETGMLRSLYMKGLHYKPKKYFPGNTECFKTASILILRPWIHKIGI